MFSSSNRSQNWSVTVLGRHPRILQRLLLCDGDSASFDPAEFSQPGKTQTTPSSQSEFGGFEWKTAAPRLILSHSNRTVQYMASLKKKEWAADMALGYFNVPLSQRIVCTFRFFLAQPWRLADREVFFSTSGSPKAALTRALPCAPGFGFLRVLGSHESISISIYLVLTCEAAEIQDMVNNFVETWQTGRLADNHANCNRQRGPCDVQLCALRSFSPCARPLHGTVGFLKFSNCFASRGKKRHEIFPFLWILVGHIIHRLYMPSLLFFVWSEKLLQSAEDVLKCLCLKTAWRTGPTSCGKLPCSSWGQADVQSEWELLYAVVGYGRVSGKKGHLIWVNYEMSARSCTFEFLFQAYVWWQNRSQALCMHCVAFRFKLIAKW